MSRKCVILPKIMSRKCENGYDEAIKNILFPVFLRFLAQTLVGREGIIRCKKGDMSKLESQLF